MRHRIPRLRRDKVIAFANLPASTQSSIGSNQSQRDIAAGDREAVLRLVKVLLGGKNRGEIENTLTILDQSYPQRTFRGLYTLLQEYYLVARFHEHHEPIFNLLLRLQHLVL